MQNQKTCVIVANGEFATHQIPLDSIKNADFIIACDGACNKLAKHNIKFDIGIGDFDSIDTKNLQNQNLIQITEQNTNDLCKAFLKAVELGFSSITIVCAAGLRDDHHMGNIFYLEYFKDIAPHTLTKLQSNFGEFICYKGSFTKQSHKSQQISLFCTDKNAVFNSSNLKYPLKNFKFEYMFSGTLNEALSDSFSIQTNKENKMIVFSNYMS